VGGSLRIPLIANKLTFGAKGLYGPGMGRYGNSTLSDVTDNATGGMSPIHNLSGLLTLEATPTPRLSIYLNYGGDYAGRTDYSKATTTTWSINSKPWFCPTGATGTSGANSCTSSPTALQLTDGGTWGAHYTEAQAAVGYGSRFASNSGCNTTTAPGNSGSGSSAGYTAGGSCGDNTRDVQEITGGYWYDIYKGDKGRLRQGVQYGYAVREGWSGVSGIQAKGIDNMVWTSLRYYLP
jgi:hypothetical protein